MALNQVGLERLGDPVTKKIGTNKNIIINGAMQVAQRGTSSTSDGYHTVDRFQMGYGGENEAPTQAPVDIASGTTPYTLGFRKAFKITNGDQTGGAGAGDYIRIANIIEGQDINGSGWNYLSSSSFITLSFWVKSSVAQNFYGFIRNTDGTMYQYPFETGSLTADTWTKVTKTIPGNSNLQFDNDNGGAWELYIHQFAGTNETASGVTLNAWATYSGTAKMPDNTPTWYTTNDATFELTGVQLEVGSVGTDFEFKSFGQELALCQRYYVEMGGGNYGDYTYMTGYLFNNGNGLAFGLYLPCAMRATPTIAVTGNLNAHETGNTVSANSPAVGGYDTNSNWIACTIGLTSDMGSNGDLAALTNTNNAGITLSAEL